MGRRVMAFHKYDAGPCRMRQNSFAMSVFHHAFQFGLALPHVPPTPAFAYEIVDIVGISRQPEFNLHFLREAACFWDTAEEVGLPSEPICVHVLDHGDIESDIPSRDCNPHWPACDPS